jgi:Nucleoside phosphorylase
MSNNHTKKIGLIVSGKYEALSFLRYIPDREKIKSGKYNLYRFRINKHEVSLIISARSMNKAMQATKLLIEKTSPDLIISVGCGAAAESNMQVGDVVYGNAVTMPEDGVFEQYYSLSSLHPEFQRIIFDIVFGFKVNMHLGTIITVNNAQPILHHEKIDFKYPILDLEMMGITHAALGHHIPALALRGIAHNLPKQGKDSLCTIFNFTWHYNKKAALRELILKPWLILQLPAFLKQKITASHHVASTAYSLLQVLSFDFQSDYDKLEYTL